MDGKELDGLLEKLYSERKHAAISESKLISMKAKSGYGNRVYAKGRYLKILGLKIWKEIPISPPKPIDQVLIPNK
jgi:hypothetical protein